ncbi:MAG: hypothetical protein LBG59_01320 [Candidatus Peribacteria bacterium]|nr:hypothetical protein [Candidatus Peribacteria bacterium]
MSSITIPVSVIVLPVTVSQLLCESTVGKGAVVSRVMLTVPVMGVYRQVKRVREISFTPSLSVNCK